MTTEPTEPCGYQQRPKVCICGGTPHAWEEGPHETPCACDGTGVIVNTQDGGYRESCICTALAPDDPDAGIIHGFQPTAARCPYCGNGHGMLQRDASGQVRYQCWCGAKSKVTLDPGDPGYREVAINGHH